MEKGSKVVCQRLSYPIGVSYEETSYQINTTTSGSGGNGRKGSGLRWGKKTTKQLLLKSEQSARSQSRGNGGAKESSASATKTMTSTTKVGRRGGAGGPTSTTTETKSKTTTTRTMRKGK